MTKPSWPVALSVAPPPRVTERQLAQMHRVLSGRAFASIDEANAFLQSICSAPATKLCALCLDRLEDTFFCKDHARAHVAGVHDEDEAALLPVVNSPRMGVCGYTGPQDDRYDIRPS